MNAKDTAGDSIPASVSRDAEMIETPAPIRNMLKFICKRR